MKRYLILLLLLFFSTIFMPRTALRYALQKMPKDLKSIAMAR
ncbi:MAG: hypothetical protein AAGJ12_16830 [Bacteroidota bacterium]